MIFPAGYAIAMLAGYLWAFCDSGVELVLVGLLSLYWFLTGAYVAATKTDRPAERAT